MITTLSDIPAGAVEIPVKSYAVGTLAFFDTLSAGLIPCKVVAVADGAVNIKLTATRKAYKRGEIIAADAFSVVPRNHVFTRGFHYRIRTNYRWTEKQSFAELASAGWHPGHTL